MKHIIDTDELALQLARKIMQEVNTHTIPSDVQRMPQLQAKIQVLISETIANSPQADDVRKDAERYRWLRDNNATVIEVQEEKRGYRSTLPDAPRERWLEHSGWNVSTLPMTSEFKTMDEAVDFAIDKARE